MRWIVISKPCFIIYTIAAHCSSHMNRFPGRYWKRVKSNNADDAFLHCRVLSMECFRLFFQRTSSFLNCTLRSINWSFSSNKAWTKMDFSPRIRFIEQSINQSVQFIHSEKYSPFMANRVRFKFLWISSCLIMHFSAVWLMGSVPGKKKLHGWFVFWWWWLFPSLIHIERRRLSGNRLYPCCNRTRVQVNKVREMLHIETTGKKYEFIHFNLLMKLKWNSRRNLKCIH